MPTEAISTRKNEQRTRTGFPLASLVLLLTVCASLLVCIDIDRCRQQITTLSVSGNWASAIIFGGAAIVGALVGLIFAILRRLRWRSVLLAPIVGIGAGEVGALILVAPTAFWRTILSVVILLTTVIVLRSGAD
jgi:hypothetical protein